LSGHHHTTDRKVSQTVKNFNKSFQNETKKIKNHSSEHKERVNKKRMHGQLPRSTEDI